MPDSSNTEELSIIEQAIHYLRTGDPRFFQVIGRALAQALEMERRDG